jgi:hypothetical protein
LPKKDKVIVAPLMSLHFVFFAASIS